MLCAWSSHWSDSTKRYCSANTQHINLFYVHGLFGRRGDMTKLSTVLKTKLPTLPSKEFHHHHLSLLNHHGGVRNNQKHRTVEFLEQLKTDIESDAISDESSSVNIIIGHSLGGTISSHLASHHPELLSGLCLLDILPPCALSPKDVGRKAFASKTYDRRPFSIITLLMLLRGLEIMTDLTPQWLSKQLWHSGKQLDQTLLKLPFGWKQLSPVGRRYILRAYRNPKCEHILEFNVKPLIKFFQQQTLLKWRDMEKYKGPIMLIAATSSGFTPDHLLDAVEERLPNIEVRRVEGGHWMLSNTEQLEDVATLVSKWLHEDVMTRLNTN